VGKLASELLDLVPPDVHSIASRLQAAGLRAWIVGGCTRDLLLGRPVHDWDLATDARPDQVVELFRRVIPTGIQHGTVTVMLGRSGYEVTTLRGEGAYSDGRHPDSVTFVGDLVEDLARRDFTINAIALDPRTGEVTDPFQGQDDLRARSLRAVGEPERRFSEDGLRLMRAARFSAVLGFEIEPATFAAMSATVQTLEKVSQERVRDELLKTLQAARPSIGLEVMRLSGILRVVLPELLPMHGCAQNRYHAYDVWDHTLAVVDSLRPDPVLRLAALLHDVGKPAVRGVNETTGDYTFYHHEVVGGDMSRGICARLKLSNQQRELVADVVRHHLVVYDDAWSDSAVRRWLNRIGEELVEPVLELATADAHGKGLDASEVLVALDKLRGRVSELRAAGMALSVRDLAVDGRTLMEACELKPGPVVGQTLRHLLDAVIENPSLNERGELIALARRYLDDTRPPAG